MDKTFYPKCPKCFYRHNDCVPCSLVREITIEAAGAYSGFDPRRVDHVNGHKVLEVSAS